MDNNWSDASTFSSSEPSSDEEQGGVPPLPSIHLAQKKPIVFTQEKELYASHTVKEASTDDDDDKPLHLLAAKMNTKRPPSPKRTVKPRHPDRPKKAPVVKEPFTILVSDDRGLRTCTIQVEPRHTVARHIVRYMQYKRLIDLSKRWTLYEQILSFGVERPLREWETLLDVQKTWTGLSQAKFVLRKSDERYGLRKDVGHDCVDDGCRTCQLNPWKATCSPSGSRESGKSGGFTCKTVRSTTQRLLLLYSGVS
jgi:hypothetical protein